MFKVGHFYSIFIAGMGGMGGDKAKMDMIFITIRDKFLPKDGDLDKMAKNFQSMLSLGGTHVSIMAVEKN